jgi:hypothetical protein
MKTLPIIFVLDLDATLIGKSSAYQQYQTFIELFRASCVAKKEDGSAAVCAGRLPDWKAVVADGFFRPGTRAALDGIKATFPSAEFFIYSSGTKDYVARMIGVMEERLGIATGVINRPIFARDDAVDNMTGYVKSVRGILPAMLAALERKGYKGCTAHADEILADRLVIVDDNDVIWDVPDKWIQCPDYDYTPVVEIDRALLDHVRQNKGGVRTAVKEWTSSSNALLPPDLLAAKTDDDFYMQYHLYLANEYRKAAGINAKAAEDDFFPRLAKALAKFKDDGAPLSAKRVAALRRRVGK